jgi:hypothetical protein
MAISQKNPRLTQQSGLGWSGFSPAILPSSWATRCCGSQNCRARWSGSLRSVAFTGERKSVGSIGSHTTSTRSEGSAWRCKSCWTAETPRRQVAQVGERRSTNRGPSMDLSKVSWNTEKFAAVSVARGSCPGGAEESMRRYATTRSRATTATPIPGNFFFTSRHLKDDRQ